MIVQKKSSIVTCNDATFEETLSSDITPPSSY